MKNNTTIDDMVSWFRNSTDCKGSKTWMDGTPFFYEEGAKYFNSKPIVNPYDFELKRNGTHCKVYVNANCSPYPSDTQLDDILTQFDGNIWTKDTETFGDPGNTYTNIMIEIIDGPYGVGGYYSGGDEIYVDCADISSWGFEIIAHEFQHLINDHIKGNDELWMNEGCSMYAMYVCYPASSTLPGYVQAFEANPNKDLTSFANSMNDYGCSYVWVRYITDCYGGSTTIKNYIADSKAGIAGINDVLLPYQKTFNDIFPDWTIANYLDDKSLDVGEFGYSDLSIQVSAQGNHNFPWSGNGTVVKCGAQYNIVSSTSLVDAKVQFSGSINNVSGIIGAIGKSGKPNQVYKLALDSGGYAATSVMGIDDNYSDIVFVATGNINGGNYIWDLSQFVPRQDSPPSTPSVPNGPASGLPGIDYEYNSSSTDPDLDQILYTFDWGDGSQSNTVYYVSGLIAESQHIWKSRGTFAIQVIASDCLGSMSDWSDMSYINIENSPPVIPSVLNGPAMVAMGEKNTYMTSTTDPDGDRIQYILDWGDGTTSDSAFWNSGTTVSLDHIWYTAGQYDISVMAKDEVGGFSSWAKLLTVSVKSNNTPPNVPIGILGPSGGETGDEYTYSTVITDPDNNNVQCKFDWGDGTNTTTSLQNSGSTISAKHIWSSPGNYSIKAKAIDDKGAESAWSSQVIMKIIYQKTPPDTPGIPKGPATGFVGDIYEYSDVAIDIHSYKLKCLFDWGDGTNCTTGFDVSGAKFIASHIWISSGLYYVRVKAINSNGMESAFSSSVAMNITENSQASCILSGSVGNGSASSFSPVINAIVKLYKSGFELRNSITNSEGVYLFTSLVPGTYEVAAEKEGFYNSYMINISLVDNKMLSNVNFTLYPIINGQCLVEVIVQDPSGNLLNNVEIKLTISGGKVYTKYSDSNGIASFSALGSGSCSIDAMKSGYAKVDQNNITMTSGIKITVILKLNGNNPSESNPIQDLYSNQFAILVLIIILVIIVLCITVISSWNKKNDSDDDEPILYDLSDTQTQSLRKYLDEDNNHADITKKLGKKEKPTRQSTDKSKGKLTETRTQPEPTGQDKDLSEPENKPSEIGTKTGTKLKFCKNCGFANENPTDKCEKCNEPLS